MDAQAEAQAMARYISSSVPEIKVERSDPMDDINCQYFQADLSQASNYRFQLLSSHSQRGESSMSQSQRVPNYQVDGFHSQMPTKSPANLQQKSNRTQNPAKTSKNSNLSLRLRQLISVMEPQIGMDKGLQLRSLCIKLLRNEVSKKEFLLLMKEIAGEQIMKKSSYQLRTQLAEAQANMSRNIPSSAREVKVNSTYPIAGINCQNSQGIQNLVVQSQREQNFPFQSRRLSNYQCYEYQNSITNQNPTTLQQEFHQQTISTRKTTVKLEEHEFYQQTILTQNPTNESQGPFISFKQLFSMRVPQLDMNKTLQLQALFIKAEGQADVSQRIPSSAQEVKIEPSDPVSDINCQNFQATHLFQGPNYQYFESQNPIAHQNLANLLQTSHQHKIWTQHMTNKSQLPTEVSLTKLIPVIILQLDMVKAMQLEALYMKLRRNEFSKERFVKLMKEIVDRPIIEMAIYQLLAQAKAEGGSSKIPQLGSQLWREPVTSKQTMSTMTAANKSNKDEQVNVWKPIPMKIPKLDKEENMQLLSFWASLAAQNSQIETSKPAFELLISGSSADDKTNMV